MVEVYGNSVGSGRVKGKAGAGILILPSVPSSGCRTCKGTCPPASMTESGDWTKPLRGSSRLASRVSDGRGAVVSA